MANFLEVLTRECQGHNLYRPRRAEYNPINPSVPFRTSPHSFQLTDQQSREIHEIGQDITYFVQAVDELYRSNEEVSRLLDQGKPQIFCIDRPSQYLFVRPDLIITESGFTICEVETSPFGLALAHLLNHAHQVIGDTTIVDQNTLPDYIQSRTPVNGIIIYSKKTDAFEGQVTFLADHVFSSADRHWEARRSDALSNYPDNIYRAFYLHEYLHDPSIRLLIDRSISDPKNTVLPSLTPHLEEKAILALLWDKRWEHFLRKQLGDCAFNHLRKVVPATWVVGQEKYFSGGLPDGVDKSSDLATLSRSKRTLVLKPSGFSQNSSWSEGVIFLHEKSAEEAKRVLHEAEESPNLYVVQEFRKGVKMPLDYYDRGEDIATMIAKVRITPYFSMPEGKLIAIKATGCENTDYIHASSTSINTAVTQKAA